jgi:hypothetical protein
MFPSHMKDQTESSITFRLPQPNTKPSQHTQLPNTDCTALFELETNIHH